MRERSLQLRLPSFFSLKNLKSIEDPHLSSQTLLQVTDISKPGVSGTGASKSLYCLPCTHPELDSQQHLTVVLKHTAWSLSFKQWQTTQRGERIWHLWRWCHYQSWLWTLSGTQLQFESQPTQCCLTCKWAPLQALENLLVTGLCLASPAFTSFKLSVEHGITPVKIILGWPTIHSSFYWVAGLRGTGFLHSCLQAVPETKN